MDLKTKMVIIKYVLLVMLAAVCCISSYTDVRYGVVKTRLLLAFFAVALVLDFVLYGFISRDIAILFLSNAGVSILIAIILFYSNNFAGGDCKLAVVLSVLYPATAYLTYHESQITLFLGIAFSIFLGYVYLLLSSIVQLITGHNVIEKGYFSGFIKNYLKSYLSALLYVTLINLLFVLLQYYTVEITPWLPWSFSILVVFIFPRLSILKRRNAIIIILIIDIVLAIYLRVIPFSLNPETYLITAFFMLAQMTIRTNIYEQIDTKDIRSGMILTTGASMMFQGIHIEGLPGLSSESLKDRLSEGQAAAIRQWGASRAGQKKIMIIKKIPFAIFLSLGYLSYYMLWSISR